MDTRTGTLQSRKVEISEYWSNLLKTGLFEMENYFRVCNLLIQSIVFCFLGIINMKLICSSESWILLICLMCQLPSMWSSQLATNAHPATGVVKNNNNTTFALKYRAQCNTCQSKVALGGWPRTKSSSERNKAANKSYLGLVFQIFRCLANLKGVEGRG